MISLTIQARRGWPRRVPLGRRASAQSTPAMPVLVRDRSRPMTRGDGALGRRSVGAGAAHTVLSDGGGAAGPIRAAVNWAMPAVQAAAWRPACTGPVIGC
ncbi:hypothetical protein GCM10009759_62650 [Kitasatospora saccharophila]|uniref:Uncharacterized protein n=1 Tax=Kitasatospora saccharophila TaxID=407973 RepID=A0ABN2XVC6_9ACTN